MYSDLELEAIGIKRIEVPGRGASVTNAYIYKCAKCGIEVQKMCVFLTRPIYCELCRRGAREKKAISDKIAAQEAKELELLMGIDPVHEDRFFNATQVARRAGNYENAISKASAFTQKFGSVAEAVAAIMLISCEINIVPQAPIFGDKRCVDFMLPDYKVCIEVDGKLFHTDANKQEIRDYVIKYRLGDEWDIIHIPAEDLVRNPKAFKRGIKRRFAKKNNKAI